ncbi:MAG: hypothetical protein Q4C87_11370, partial [Actinomycetaceae bacterium]|nr:hypothetical protein [Actinomycetaceae bacterium]
FQKKLARKDPLHSSPSKEGEDITITARRRTPRQTPPTTTLRRRSLTPQQRIQRSRHRRVRAVIAIMALPLAVGAFALYIDAAPRNVTRLGAEGLSALIVPGQPISHAAYGAAACAALVALAARWSLLGPQLSAWFLLVAPTYVLIPAWSTLTGNVVTPNQPFLIALSIASPVIASVGMVVGASTLAVHWTRRAYTPVEDESPEASSPTQGGDGDNAGSVSSDSANEGEATPARTSSPA